MPTYGSLFSGIGGIDLGLDRSGWTCKWQVEIDEKARAVLEKHWTGVPKFGDIRGVGAGVLEPVDLVAGGFPCQPFSVAGKRKGAADERWLWPEFARVVGELGPRYVLVENVPGLLTKGEEFGRVLADLAALGFDAEWACLPAALFGAGHYRLRLFLVAYPKGDGRLEGWSMAAQDLWEPGRLPVDWTAAWNGSEPEVGRVVSGFPGRVGQLTQLGNAVVPQVAQWVGEQLMAFHERTIRDGAV